MTNTALGIARQQAERFESNLASFVCSYCGIRETRLNDGGAVFFVGRDYDWSPLTDEGHRARAALNAEYQAWTALFRVLLADQPPDAQHRDRLASVDRILMQDGRFLGSDKEDVLESALKELKQQVKLLDYLPGLNTEPILVPDTNALLHNHRIETWRFAEYPRFRLALTPTVSGELDEKKMHRNESVQKKAESLIRQIGEWRRRGRLIDGVTIVRGVSSVFSVATEPQFERTLSWLDPSSADDRLLATTLEIMRANPRAPVALITRDVNAQNKAELAGIPLLSPPDPETAPQS